MWTFTLPLILLATYVASSSFAVPIDLVDDFSAIDFLSHPDDATVLYRYDNHEDEQRSDIVEADEPRHLEKRSPIFPFDPITKTLKLKAKKFAKKALLKSPKIKKFGKLGAFGLVGAGGLAAPSLAGTAFQAGVPALGAGLGGGGAAVFGPPALQAAAPFLRNLPLPGRRKKRSPFIGADEPRHLEKRSPFPPFDPISKTLKTQLKFQVKTPLLKKALLKSPKIKKFGKKAAKLGAFGLVGAGGLGAASLSGTAFPTLGAGLGGAGGAFGPQLVAALPFRSINGLPLIG